jgi:zinc transport system substrate-binding protein
MKYLIMFAIALGLLTAKCNAEIKVVVSIKPIHSLVAGVMQGVGKPILLLDGSSSPHNFQLKPSNAAALQDANVVFWIGKTFESFLEKPLKELGQQAKEVAFLDQGDISTLPIREGNGFAGHDDEIEDHAMQRDGHVWLNPDIAAEMVTIIQKTLVEADPEHRVQYSQNADQMKRRLKQLDDELRPEISPLRGKNFITFHDAYQYFEHHFGLKSMGAIALHPENSPGAAAISKIRDQIKMAKAICIFAEPQFESKLLDALTEGTAARRGTLDPLGALLNPGPELYFQMMHQLASAFSDCLGKN